jgi:hypothetical protein
MSIVAVARVTELHTPPPKLLLRVIVAVGHKLPTPVIVAATGNGSTVIIADVVAVPQLFVTA